MSLLRVLPPVCMVIIMYGPLFFLGVKKSPLTRVVQNLFLYYFITRNFTLFFFFLLDFSPLSKLLLYYHYDIHNF